MSLVHVEIFDDPTCPYGFSSERQRAQLLWHYRDQVSRITRQIVLSEFAVEWEDLSWTAEGLAKHDQQLQQQYGMPIAGRERPRIGAGIDAARAIVGARRIDIELGRK